MMVRYTIRLKTGEARCCQLDGNAVVERLAQYEDSGLLPEEVERVKLALMGKGIYEIKEFDGLPIKRLRELAEADKGECVLVLPCKVGTPVYRIHYPIAIYPDRSEPEIRSCLFVLSDLNYWGRTVFRTKDEAEKALLEIERKN